MTIKTIMKKLEALKWTEYNEATVRSCFKGLKGGVKRIDITKEKNFKGEDFIQISINEGTLLETEVNVLDITLELSYSDVIMDVNLWNNNL